MKTWLEENWRWVFGLTGSVVVIVFLARRLRNASHQGSTFACANCSKDFPIEEGRSAGFLANVFFLFASAELSWPYKVCRECARQVRGFLIGTTVIVGASVGAVWAYFWWWA